ncbi:HTH-type transcriptional regulator BenM [Nonomuraea coxensis DSM 45129]|uniref:HTH-type transcriptional regulator BenM n=1 Tax=Nonomuraea coxensis DSM 45129 TaxID=1122611 RepID=A0ABX8U359_9ACTN|nr:LysR family transcriptional regulator [Nonomuraea coxensis]QYC42078.1 HTH-type transcriptional regulator BenM [Nonomuraea coxensis DSM 45129]
MVSLRQLQYVITVVEQGSFTRAAEILHVTQPALSHQVQALERAVGAVLLERSPRGVHLTPAGRAMLPHARAALAETADVVSAVRRATGLIAGELRLATVYSVSLGLLPEALRLWSRHHPGVDMRLFEHRHSDELAQAMASGQADLAIGPRRESWPGPVQPLGVEEFVIAVSRDDPLAARQATEVDLAALSGRRWVHYAPGNGLAEVLDRACSNAGFQPEIAVRTEQTASAPVLAAAGLGPALIPANIVPRWYEGYTLRPAPPITRELTAYARTTLDSLSNAFLTILTAVTSDRLLRPS